MYVSAAETVGIIRDYANARTINAPTLVRGCSVCLLMRLFQDTDSTLPYPIEAFDNIIAWEWIMDKDFDSESNAIIKSDESAISVSSVTDNDGTSYTQFRIPISNLNTEELSSWLKTSKSQKGLVGELIGYNSDGEQSFVLQVEGFTIRNRIVSLGNPTEVAPEYLNAQQVRSLIAAGLDVQYSSDGESDWKDEQAEGDVYIRFKSASSDNGLWSSAILLPAGPQGIQGLTPTITVGNVTTVPSDSPANITVNTVGNIATVDFEIPEGKQGLQGETTNIVLGNVITGEIGSSAQANLTTVGTTATLDLTLPRGLPPEIQIGTVETVSPGDSARVYVDNVGNTSTLRFKIPRGYQGFTPTVEVDKVVTSEPGTNAIVSVHTFDTTAKFSFTIPKGDKGDIGLPYKLDAFGTLEELTLYDDEAAGFGFMDTETGNAYIKIGDESAQWSNPIPFKGPQGDKGEQGDTPIIQIGTVSTGLPESNALVEVVNDGLTSTFNFVIPEGKQGEQGIRGEAFKVDAIGSSNERSNYDNESKNFAFLNVDDNCVYFKITDDAANWSNGVPLKGDAGKTFYTYVAYATDSNGSNFIQNNEDWTTEHSYIAILITEKENVTVEDFTNLWKPFYISNASNFFVNDPGEFFTGNTLETVIQEVGTAFSQLKTFLQEL